MSSASHELCSRLLKRLAEGDREVERELFELLYDELKSTAQAMMRRQSAAHTLQATALVHEAWLKLAERESAGVTSRTHFFRVAARAMRSVLVDHARARATDKRGGAAVKLAIDGVDLSIDRPSETLLSLDEALTKLQSVDAALARVAEMRLFTGLEHDEIAQALDVSSRTVERAWKLAREWLQRYLEDASRS